MPFVFVLRKKFNEIFLQLLNSFLVECNCRGCMTLEPVIHNLDHVFETFYVDEFYLICVQDTVVINICAEVVMPVVATANSKIFSEFSFYLSIRFSIIVNSIWSIPWNFVTIRIFYLKSLTCRHCIRNTVIL